MSAGKEHVSPLLVGDASVFERQVLGRLRRLGMRLRSYVLLGGLARVCVWVLLAAAVQLGLDYTFRLPRDMRAALLAVIVLGLGFLMWRRLWLPLSFPYGVREMAGLIERRYPELRSVLVSAVQFASGQVGRPESNSPELMGIVVQRACGESAGVPFNAVLAHGRARRGFVTIIVVMAIAVSALLISPEVMGMWFDRNVLLSDREWPKRTRLRVHLDGGVLTGARGDDLEVRASAEGEVPRRVDITFVFESGKTGTETMIAVGERDFRYTFTRVEDPFRFRLKGGDDETVWFETRLADRPKVEEVSISVTPPSYARIEFYTLPAGQRAVEMLKGSEVKIEVRLNKPVVRAELMAGQEVVIPAGGSFDKWSVTMTPDETRTYHFALLDDLDLENKHPVRISVRIIKDDAPRVRLKVPGVSDIITPQALLPIEMSFSDTYGLSRAEMVYKIGREGYGPEVVELSDFKPYMTVFDTKLSWAVESISLIPGDRLTLHAEAADFDDISGPNEGRSAEATYRVLSRDDLLAELARREQEYRMEFERVIELQERLRGQLLSLIRRMDEADVRRELSTLVAPFERRQRQITGQVNLLRQQFEEILAELQVNGLDTATVLTRLRDGVVTPLTQLAKRDLVSAAGLLREFGRSGTAEGARAADDNQAAVLAEMRRILTNMLKWEGFQEAVTMLREILRLQGELSEETREEIERRATEILEGG